VRLRPLTEAECYARCYGDIRSDQVSVLRPPDPGPAPELLEPREDEPAGVQEEAA
jgi:hypothetical protein